MRLKSATGVWGRPADLQKRLDMRSPSKWFTIRPKSLTASCCASSFPSPTIQRELNRQGPDVGTSYRSAIFYVNDDQKRIANAYIAQLDTAKVFPARIVTEVMLLKGFYVPRTTTRIMRCTTREIRTSRSAIVQRSNR